jgi:hypothetical protein
MRQTISALAMALATMTAGAAPAMACGWGTCWPCGAVYAAPCFPTYDYVYAGCYAGCVGWVAYERLTDPLTQYHSVYRAPQYYYVNQGPTYTGPGDFAPYPTYRQAAVSVWDARVYRRQRGYPGTRYVK